jgi:kynureninase
MKKSIDLNDCQTLDEQDPLRSLRAKFSQSESGAIHYDANSMGAMPKAVPEQVAWMLNEGWRNLSRQGWSKLDWLDKPKKLAAGIAHLLGANPEDVIVCDSTSINLYKLLSYAWRIRKGGNILLTESNHFPTDIYIAEGWVKTVQELGSEAEIRFANSHEEVMDSLNEEVAVVSLTYVDYRTSLRWEMSRLMQKAKEVGALVVWDLSHAAGAVRIDLMECDADFAVGCSYKYLCGGPGAPAYLFIHPRHQNQTWPTIAGWMGHLDVFAFAQNYEAHPSIISQTTGSPAIMANEIFSAAVEIWQEVQVDELDRKHESLTQLFWELLEQECGPLGAEMTSPRNHSQQGGHVSIRHPGAGPVSEALLEHGVVSSFRKPDSIRFGISPLYHSHEDIWAGIQRLKEVLSTEVWQEERFQKVSV